MKYIKLFESNKDNIIKLEYDKLSKYITNNPPEKFTKLDINLITKYFAEYGSKANFSNSYDDCNATINDKFFSLTKRPDEWFLLYIHINDKYVRVSDSFYKRNLYNPEYRINGVSNFFNDTWTKTTPKPGYEGKWLLKKNGSEEHFKCDQLNSVFDKIDSCFKKKKKVDSSIFFAKEKRKDELHDMKKQAVSIVRGWSYKQLSDFLKNHK